MERHRVGVEHADASITVGEKRIAVAAPNAFGEIRQMSAETENAVELRCQDVIEQGLALVVGVAKNLTDEMLRAGEDPREGRV